MLFGVFFFKNGGYVCFEVFFREISRIPKIVYDAKDYFLVFVIQPLEKLHGNVVWSRGLVVLELFNGVYQFSYAKAF